MKLIVSLFISIFSCVAIAAPATAKKPAQRTPVKRSAPSSQQAVVKIETAMVYDQPTFDGSVLQYFSQGQRVRISLRTYGRDVGRFYRVILKNNKVGYIADIDVQVLKNKKSGESDSSQSVSEEEKKQRGEELRLEREASEQEARKRANREPLAFATLIGPFYANWGMKEKISGISAQERISVFGVKYNSPRLLPGAILDLNLGLHLGAPKYYEQVSEGKPKGFILLIDAEFLSPVVFAQDSFGYFGLGPLINYTAIQIQSLGQPVDSNDLRLGLVLTLGYAQRLGSITGRLEGKYIIEKTQQTVFVFSLQMPL